MRYRHEWKHEINYTDMLILRQRLCAVAKYDLHTIDGKYQIRSLYFDNASDKALREKIDGVNQREKFRIRYYNGDTSFIRLEKKSKINGLCRKKSVPLKEAQARAIVNGRYRFMKTNEHALIHELYLKIITQGLRPKVIVDYTREPYTFAPGNVRVTMDSQIRTSLFCEDFLNPESITIPVRADKIILEVKWDDFLPDIIRDAVRLQGRHSDPFSKYAAGRVYG